MDFCKSVYGLLPHSKANLVAFFAMLSASIFTVTPLLFFTQDSWDGVIIGYAFQTQIYDIMDTWFLDAGAPVVATFYKLLIWCFSFVPVNYKTLLNLLSIFLLLLAARQLYCIARDIFGFSAFASKIVAIIYILNPSWHILTSSIFITIPLWNLISFAAIRLLASEINKIGQVFGVILLFVSCHYAANPMLVFPILAGLFIGLGKVPANHKGLLWLIFATIYFVIFRNLFAANSLYSEYNQINPNHIFDIDLYVAFAQYFITHYWFVLIAVMWGFFTLRNRVDYFRLAFFVLLPILSVIPYIVVNKVIAADLDWSARTTINLTTASALLFGFLVSEIASGEKRQNYLLLLLAVPFAFLLNKLYLGYDARLKGVLYQELFVTSLQQMEKPNPGLIFTKNLSGYAPDSYELNYYFFRAYGATDWFVNLDDSGAAAISMTQNQRYRDKYVASNFTHKCTHTLTRNDNVDDIPTLKGWYWLFGFQDLQTLNVDSGTQLNFRTKGCTQSSATSKVNLSNPELDIKSLKQADISACTSFNFTPGTWQIRDNLIFGKECKVRFVQGSTLRFKKGTFMVLNGSVYFPETKVSVFEGELKENGNHEKWGGILVQSPVAHIQHIHIKDTTGFTYENRDLPAGINLVGNTNNSIHRSRFSNNYRFALHVNNKSTRLTENYFHNNRRGIELVNTSGAAINNVISGSDQVGLQIESSDNLQLIKNMFIANAGKGLVLKGSGQTDTFYNLFQNNKLALELNERTLIKLEADLFFQNQENADINSGVSQPLDGAGTIVSDTNTLNVKTTSLSLTAEKLNEHFVFTNAEAATAWKKSIFQDCNLCREHLVK